MDYKFEITYEERDGYTFPQPVERINGKSYFESEKNSYVRKKWANILKGKLNDQFDVLWHDVGSGAHLHVEFDPKV